ncbi:hypothetical protein KVR01_012810 [Diaporthe batatas]|uniref:uncharacterized protein n=1 Tax=Diaporthe batatas TaxID=748121 RepID=UPI001D056023|nr:uncharacterized protein KVR01_012810 [Diaporthe batatas]KAG8157426.1 hypothetical protein KVR01_012810 [Diaporthe batatas]
MSNDQRAGHAGTREYLEYESSRAGAQVQYHYADEYERRNVRAQRQARRIAEYNAEFQRAIARGRRFGYFRDVDTERMMPFEHLGESQSVNDLRRTLQAYADQSYPADAAELIYVEAFTRQLKDLKKVFADSWTGADLCLRHDRSDEWSELLNVFTGFLREGNNFYDRIQMFITREGRRRADAQAARQFMTTFNAGRERADLTGDMRRWVRDVEEQVASFLNEAQAFQRHYENAR